jgi:ribosome-associated protein
MAARAACSKQGADIVVLDVSELITITDYFVIISGSSDRQLKSIAEEVERAVKERGVKPVRQEGDAGATWLLIDYVDFVVHVFDEEERDFYRLENLWRDAPVIEWEEPAEASGG